MDQRFDVYAPPAEDGAVGTSCDCTDPEPSASGVCMRCFRLMWQTGPHVSSSHAWVRDAPPVPGTLVCPVCGKPHIDEGEWARRPHRTHLCVDDAQGAGCGATWEIGLMLPGVGWLRLMGVPAGWVQDAATSDTASAGTGLPGGAEPGGAALCGAGSAPAAEPGSAPAPAAGQAGNSPPVVAPYPMVGGAGRAGLGAPGVHIREVSFGARRVVRR
jgi:hypothetical protein